MERGPVRLFGVSFERNTPGVIYNSLGLNGGQVQSVVRYFDKPQWTEELQHQHPDLVVINYGTNESIYADYIERSYPGELRQVIERVKAAVPRASVLDHEPHGSRAARFERPHHYRSHAPAPGGDPASNGRGDGLRVLQYLSGHGRRRNHGALVRQPAADW